MITSHDKLADEAEAVLHFFESRGLDPMDACAVMGAALTTLLRDRDMARSFVRYLASDLEKNIAREEAS